MNKTTYYSQGVYVLTNPLKYKGTSPVIYRSSWEYKMMKWFDINTNILEWSSESIIIPYIKPTDGKLHRYFIDFSCILKNKEGKIEKYLIEVKPFKQLNPPKQTKRISPKTYVYQLEQYMTNSSKWDAARQYAAKHNMKFQIVTEKEIG